MKMVDSMKKFYSYLKIQRFLFCLIFYCENLCLFGAGMEFSTAGFYPLPDTGRQAYSLNPAWRLYKGEPLGNPSAKIYEDAAWNVVSLPHGLEYLPVEASGCMNYQGVAWYRKHFVPADSLKDKKLFISLYTDRYIFPTPQKPEDIDQLSLVTEYHKLLCKWQCITGCGCYGLFCRYRCPKLIVVWFRYKLLFNRQRNRLITLSVCLCDAGCDQEKRNNQLLFC